IHQSRCARVFLVWDRQNGRRLFQLDLGELFHRQPAAGHAGQHRRRSRSGRRGLLVCLSADVETGGNYWRRRVHAKSGGPQLSTRYESVTASRVTAQTLYSGILAIGSSAPMVTLLTLPGPGKWKLANTTPGATRSVTAARATMSPRRERTRTLRCPFRPIR